MIKFFKEANTIEELKSTYKKLAKIHHPDLGGDEEVMKELANEYEALYKQFSRKTGKSNEEVNEDFEFEKEFLDVIQKIIHLEGVIIQVVGRWIWLSGNTYIHRQTIKVAGFFFASKKKMWYWRPEDAKVKSRSTKSFAEIKSKYGSRDVNKDDIKRLKK